MKNGEEEKRERRKKREHQEIAHPSSLFLQPQPLSSQTSTAGPAFAPATSPSLHENWLEWEETTLRPAVAAALRGKGRGQDGQPSLSSALARLEKANSGSGFLGGGTAPALADVAVACTLLPLRSKKEHLPAAASSYLEGVISGCPQLAQAIETAEQENGGGSEGSCCFSAFATRDALSAAPAPLPLPGRKNVLVTSALPYVNNVPHLGNIIGCVLSADAFARFSRLKGDVTLFVCGTVSFFSLTFFPRFSPVTMLLLCVLYVTRCFSNYQKKQGKATKKRSKTHFPKMLFFSQDEYGTATETKAIEEQLTCSALCDKYHAVHASIYAWFGISCDRFGRTPTWQQTAIAQSLFAELDSAGLLKEESVEQLYSEAAGTFLADRFVEGTCPKCGYSDARGDQCDGCGEKRGWR